MSFNNETEEQFIQIASDFIDWMVEHLCTDEGIFHTWVSSGHWQVGLLKDEEWECTGLYNAYEHYYWGAKNPVTGENISNYEDTEDLLNLLRGELRNALENQNDADILSLCENVLKWGGVNRKNIATVFRNQLINNDQRLEYLNEAKLYLENINQLDHNVPIINIDGDAYELQLDSGTTKIFSLIMENFIIYDSRVGAALAILVKRWAFEKNTEIPSLLKFAWTGNINRNPNIDDNCSKKGTFPKFKKNLSRVPYNIAANWLCKEILNRGKIKHPKSCFYSLQNSKQLRALEAALFMIGYRVNKCEKTINTNTKSITKENISIELDGWILGVTESRKKEFQWCCFDQKLHVKTGSKFTTKSEPDISLTMKDINDLISFISEQNSVILGNSKNQKPLGDDLDRAIGWNFLLNKNKSQVYASHIMSILVSSGIVYGVKIGRKLEFTLVDENYNYNDLFKYYKDTIENP